MAMTFIQIRPNGRDKTNVYMSTAELPHKVWFSEVKRLPKCSLSLVGRFTIIKAYNAPKSRHKLKYFRVISWLFTGYSKLKHKWFIEIMCISVIFLAVNASVMHIFLALRVLWTLGKHLLSISFPWRKRQWMTTSSALTALWRMIIWCFARKNWTNIRTRVCEDFKITDFLNAASFRKMWVN